MRLNLRTSTGQSALIEGMEGEPYEPTPRAHRPPATDWNGDPYRPDTYSERAPVRLEIVTEAGQGEFFGVPDARADKWRAACRAAAVKWLGAKRVDLMMKAMELGRKETP